MVKIGLQKFSINCGTLYLSGAMQFVPVEFQFNNVVKWLWKGDGQTWV